jgi:hypothetical protein
MKKIFIHSANSKNNNLFDPNIRDNYNQPYIYLKNKLFDLGYELTTSDDNSLDEVHFVFFNDFTSIYFYHGFKGKLKKILSIFNKNYRFRDLFNEIKGTKIKPILFLWEASAVIPNNWDKKFHDKFDTILTWDDAYIDNKKYFKLFWPQTNLFPIIEKINFNQKKLLVNISMNKSSKFPLELYSERLNSIIFFDKNYPNDFDLYGFGWNQPNTSFSFYRSIKFQSFRGTVKNKWDVLPLYKFAICYENIKDTKGWVTEKIFDCFRCNCVPIYWGASNICDFIPSSTFIDRRNFKSNEELANYIIKINEIEYMEFIKNINEFLNSEMFELFLPENYFNTVSMHL